ncbi:MAG: class I SAM-dependent methyltransferase [Mycobacteriales bacterium]
MSRPDPTTFVRDHYNQVAARYDAMIGLPERLLFADGRQWAVGHARGDVLEVAVGTGRNLAHYPPGARVTGIDLSEAMLDLARTRSAGSASPVELRVADAQQLPFGDSSFDTVLATLALCSIPDDAAATREMARVLRPGGTLVLLEHVRSPSRLVRSVQQLLEPLLLRLEGDHLLREPEKRVTEAGLRLDLVERSKLGIVLRLRARKAP